MSRDKKLLVWDRTKEGVSEDGCSWEVGARKVFEVPPTAVDISEKKYIAVGFENGLISLLKRADQNVTLVLQFDRITCPTLTINAIKWRSGECEEFAVGSDDNQIIIFKVMSEETRAS